MSLKLETPRLLLRSMRWEDVEALAGVFDDPVAMAAFVAEPFRRDQMEAWVQRNLQRQECYGYGLFAMVVKESGLVIGDCGLEQMELRGQPVVELG